MALLRRLGCVCLLCAVFGLLGLDAQEAPNPSPATDTGSSSTLPVKTPGYLYKEAMHPLDVVRRSLDNWSDVELGALGVGMHKAHEECDASKPDDYTGEDLYDLARLCALGQHWEGTNKAAQQYITSGADAHRTQAYALSVNAMVHLNAIDLATQTTLEMLRKLPYDAEVAYAVRYMKDHSEQQGNTAAMEIAEREHPALVSALKQNAPLKAVHGDAAISRGALYDSAMELAFWQRYRGDNAGSAATVADIEAALKRDAPLEAEDAQMVASVRRRYALLGTKFAPPAILRSLASAQAKPAIDVHGAATVLVLFPDWCGGCRRMMKTLTEFARVNKDTPIPAYGLVFEDDSVIPVPAGHEKLLGELQGTLTLVVPAATPAAFGAVDYPLGLVLDQSGIVRFIGAIPGDAFNGDGYMQKAIERMADEAR